MWAINIDGMLSLLMDHPATSVKLWKVSEVEIFASLDTILANFCHNKNVCDNKLCAAARIVKIVLLNL